MPPGCRQNPPGSVSPDAVQADYPYHPASGSHIGPRGGRAINTGRVDGSNRTIFQREGGGYYVLDGQTGKQITVPSPYSQPKAPVQQSYTRHELAVTQTSGFYRDQGLNITTNVSIRSPQAEHASVLDQVLSGRPGQSIPVPAGYRATDLRTGQTVSRIRLDDHGFAGMEMKTGIVDRDLKRSQETNYRAAIEGTARSFGGKAEQAGLRHRNQQGITPRNIYIIEPMQ